ncbi:uncharacterized protein LOC119654773 [Hermetia illucens]|uniref:uncharacterized protein LOC119654773 n=1 Tax=Hermetia illucens TaxID=343691 RepID=UPI0018CC52AC|nr:uncharacterized protein LOC119654773 [Hermetia illucens]
MESVKKAHQRFRNYPIILGKCSKAASTYAICVTRDFNVKQSTCEKEFLEFRNCLQQAAKKMNTKL